MPNRNSSKKRIDSKEVQGDDSYIVITLPTVASAKESKAIIEDQQGIVAIAQRRLAILQTAEDATEGALKEAQTTLRTERDKLEEISQVEIAKHVLDWNWVDEDGNPLPKPHNNAASLSLLTALEMNWLSAQFQGISTQKK